MADEVFRTSDVDAFRERVATLFACEFTLTPHARRYDARLSHSRFGPLSITRIAYDNPVVIDVPPQLPVAIMQVAQHGAFHARTSGSPSLISGDRLQIVVPGEPLLMRCPGPFEVLVIALDPARFSHALAEVSPSMPDTLSMTGPRAGLAEFVRFLVSEAERETSLLRADRGGRHAEQMLLALLLEAVEQGVSAPGPGPVRAWYVKRAEEFMEANLAGDIGIADVAASAGVCMRTLHHGFKAVHGQGPLAWLKSRRLERVRAELLRADPAETGVSEVALRWGLVHLGRFAAEYRARFGETPSKTLQRR